MHPTPFGVLAVVALVLFLLMGPQVADPSMAGFVWAALLGVVIVGVAWPCATVLLVKVGPTDSADLAGLPGRAGLAGTGIVTEPLRPMQVGESASIGLTVGPRLSEVLLNWVDEDQVVPLGAGPSTSARLPLVAVRRGRYSRLALRVACDAPFGLVVASRAVSVSLPRPLEVGPRSIPVEHLPQPDAGALGELATTAAGHGGDTTRSVRPYVVGDPAHLVHWPTSARTGGLVVREMEPPADMAVAVVVDLGGRFGATTEADADAGSTAGMAAGSAAGMAAGPAAGSGDRDSGSSAAAFVRSGLPSMPTTPLADGEDRAIEGAVARAAAVVTELRMRGIRVLLCTAEPAPTVGEVPDHSSVLSRLAAATAGSPGQVPTGWSVLRITPRGDDA